MKPARAVRQAVRQVVGHFAARKTISGYLVEMGEPPEGLLESLDALRERYKAALLRHAGPEPCEILDCGQDDGGPEPSKCKGCGAVWSDHERAHRFDPLTERSDYCDACGEHRDHRTHVSEEQAAAICALTRGP